MPNTPDLTTAEGIKQLLRQAKTPAEWMRLCQRIKEVNGGEYPSFYDLTITSGFRGEVLGSQYARVDMGDPND